MRLGRHSIEVNKVSSTSKFQWFSFPISLCTPIQFSYSFLPNKNILPFSCAPPLHLHKYYHPSSSLQNLHYSVKSVTKTSAKKRLLPPLSTQVSVFYYELFMYSERNIPAVLHAPSARLLCICSSLYPSFIQSSMGSSPWWGLNYTEFWRISRSWLGKKRKEALPGRRNSLCEGPEARNSLVN